MKKTIIASLLIILGLFFTGCGSVGFSKKATSLKKNATAGYIPPNYINDPTFQLSTGAFIFDASKRMGVFNILKEKDSYTYKYLSEEQPDAIYETKEKITDVYCDELQERVDNVIEKIANYNY